MRTAQRYLAGTFVLLAAFADASANLINDSGFESTSSQASQLVWTAADYGSWAVGDPFSIVGSDAGVSPLGGAKMLRFDGTLAAGDIYQILDLTSQSAQIDAGLVTANYSAYFNATDVNNVGLDIWGWASAPTGFNTPAPVLNTVDVERLLDSDTATWEQLSNSTLLPTGLRYIALGLHANGPLRTVYADQTSLTLTVAEVPTPSSLALLGLGLAGISFGRNKQSKTGYLFT